MSRIEAIANLANFTIFRLVANLTNFVIFCETLQDIQKSAASTIFRYCAEIYYFMLIDQQAPACRFYKIYKIYDCSLTSQFFNSLHNLHYILNVSFFVAINQYI